jgi:hypothetical protein
MILRVVLFFLGIGVLAGCGEPASRDAVEATAPHSAQPLHRRSVEAFAFVGPGVTMQDVIGRVGPPDKDIGSGIHVYVYRLLDGSEILVGSSDGASILYVRRGDAVIYQRK